MMSNIHDHASDINWTCDYSMEVKQQNGVVFENIADQYVKGEDVKAFFTTSYSTKVSPTEDQIGILRVGCTNIKQCLAYRPVQFNSLQTSTSFRSGTVTFPSSSLSASNDEFYQFCYIDNKSKILGLSMPFQLNCTSDDIDFLSQNSKIYDLLASSDQEDEDIVVIHNKRSNKICKTTDDNTYRTLEDAHTKNLNETNQIRLQLNTTFQLVKDQATQIIDLEHRLTQANDLIKATKQEKLIVEQQLNDTNLTFEKYQRSMQGQLNATTKLTQEQASQITNLERSLKQSNEILNHEKMLLEQQLRDLRLTSEKYQMSTQGQLDEYAKQINLQQEQMNVLERSNSLLCDEINEEKPNDDQDYKVLKISFDAVEKRCVKHQKNEIELKRQLNVYQNSVNDLQKEVQDLTERLTVGAEEYRKLFHRCNALEREKTSIPLANISENRQMSASSSVPDVEVQKCPICDHQFPQNSPLDHKQYHIDQHFQ